MIQTSSGIDTSRGFRRAPRVVPLTGRRRRAELVAGPERRPLQEAVRATAAGLVWAVNLLVGSQSAPAGSRPRPSRRVVAPGPDAGVGWDQIVDVARYRPVATLRDSGLIPGGRSTSAPCGLQPCVRAHRAAVYVPRRSGRAAGRPGPQKGRRRAGFWATPRRVAAERNAARRGLRRLQTRHAKDQYARRRHVSLVMGPRPIRLDRITAAADEATDSSTRAPSPPGPVSGAVRPRRRSLGKGMDDATGGPTG